MISILILISLICWIGLNVAFLWFITQKGNKPSKNCPTRPKVVAPQFSHFVGYQPKGDRDIELESPPPSGSGICPPPKSP